MLRECADCHQQYDDAERFTFCPHAMLMPREDLDRKIAAIALLQKSPYVRFSHQTAKDRIRIQGITWDGMVLLYDYAGEFAPHLFVSLPESE